MLDAKNETRPFLGVQNRGDLTPRFARKIELGMRYLFKSDFLRISTDQLEQLPWGTTSKDARFFKTGDEIGNSIFQIETLQKDEKVNLQLTTNGGGLLTSVTFKQGKNILSVTVNNHGLVHLDREQTNFKITDDNSLSRFEQVSVEFNRKLITALQKRHRDNRLPAAALSILALTQIFCSFGGGLRPEPQATPQFGDRFKATVAAIEKVTPTPIPPEHELYETFENLDKSRMKYSLIYASPDGKFTSFYTGGSGVIIERGDDTQQVVFITVKHVFDHEANMRELELPEGSKFAGIVIGHSSQQVLSFKGDFFIPAQLTVVEHDQADVAAIGISLDDRFPNGLDFGEMPVNWDFDPLTYEEQLGVAINQSDLEYTNVDNLHQPFPILHELGSPGPDEFVGDLGLIEGLSGEGAGVDGKLVALAVSQVRKGYNEFASFVNLKGKAWMVKAALSGVNSAP